MITTSNSEILREILRRISQHSLNTIIQKKKDKIVIASFDKDEKSFVSASLKERFFGEWDRSSEKIMEVESENLYNLSKIIPRISKIYLDISEEKIKTVIKNEYTKEIVITGKRTTMPTFKIMEPTNKFFLIKSNILLAIVKDLDSFTEEASMTLGDKSDHITFKGKDRNINITFRLRKNDTEQVSDSTTIRTPIKYLNYFSSLFKEFSELQISAIKDNPLIIRGINEKWEFSIMLTSIVELTS